MCFPVYQVRTSIKKMNLADELKQILTYKDIEIDNLNSIVIKKDKLIELEQLKNVNLHVIILEKDKHITILQENNKKLERRYKIHKIISNVVISGLAVTTGYLLLEKKMGN